MNKKEFINKIAKLAGIPDNRKEIFFEIFLLRAYNMLKSGEAIKIKNSGYLYLYDAENNEENNLEEKANKFLIFSEMRNEKNIRNVLLFAVPSEKEEHSFIDAFFSLSSDKPAIPLEEKNEFVLPSAGDELKSLYSTKVNNLLNELEIILKGEEEKSEGINDTEIIPENPIKNLDEKKEEKSDNFSFEDFDKVIDEKESLEINIEDDEEKDLLIEPDEETFEDKKYKKIDTLDNSAEDIKEETDDQKENKFDEIEKTKNEEVSGFKLIEPDTSGFDKDIKLQEIDWDSIDYNDLSDVFSDSDFDESQDESSEEIHLNIKDKIKSDSEPGEKENQKHSVIEDVDKIKKDLDEVDKSIESKIEDTEKELKKRKKSAGLIFAVITILLIAGGIWAYNYFYDGIIYKTIFKSSEAVTENNLIKSNPVIVERDYSIPVSIPYNAEKRESIATVSAIAPGIIQSETESNEQMINEEQQDIEAVTEKNNENIEETGNNFIYRRGDEYLVQVSSWRLEKKAEEHAGFFKARGYNAYIHPKVYDGVTYFSVRVEGFSSYTKAKEFFNQYN